MLSAVTNLSIRYPLAIAKLVENTASGPWVISMLKHRIAGLIPMKVPKASKLARVKVVSPFIQAGNVFVPGKRVGDEWVPAYGRRVHRGMRDLPDESLLGSG